MLIPERIVVGVDGSTGSLDALRWAVAEAGRDPAEVWAVRVYEPAHAGAARAAARTVLQRAIAHAAPGAGVLPVVVRGFAGRMLPRMADGARLLVLGGDGHHRPGPVREACVRSAPCPVVIVVPGAGRMPLMPDGRGAATPVSEGIV